PIFQHLDLYRYWLARAAPRRMPSRGDIDPADIPLLLPNLIMVEKAADQFRNRLMGTGVAQLLGQDATGALVGSRLSSPEDNLTARSIYRRVFTSGRPVFASGKFILRVGDGLPMSTLIVPLSEDGETVNMTVSTLVARFDVLGKASRG